MYRYYLVFISQNASYDHGDAEPEEHKIENKEEEFLKIPEKLSDNQGSDDSRSKIKREEILMGNFDESED